MNWRNDNRKQAWRWDRTPDLVSSEQGCGLVEQMSASHPRGRGFDPSVMLLFFFLSVLQFILFVFFYLCCFVLFTTFTALLIYGKLFFLTRHTTNVLFFLISIFNELFKFKTSDEWEQWKTRKTALDWKGINLLLTQSQRSLCFLYSVSATLRPET